MSKDELQTLSAGNVVGWVTGRAKVTRAEWDAAVDKAWPAFIAEMSTNAGFKGATVCWTIETGEVAVAGIWSSEATRLAYEAKSASTVRVIFNQLIETPRRHKQVITKMHWHKGG